MFLPGRATEFWYCSGAATPVEIQHFTPHAWEISCCWCALHPSLPGSTSAGQAVQLWASLQGCRFNLCSCSVDLAVSHLRASFWAERKHAIHISKSKNVSLVKLKLLFSPGLTVAEKERIRMQLKLLHAHYFLALCFPSHCSSVSWDRCLFWQQWGVRVSCQHLKSSTASSMMHILMMSSFSF